MTKREIEIKVRLNQKEAEPVEQNTVKFEELEEERISDSDAVISGPIS